MIVARGRVRLRVWLIVGAVAVLALIGGAWVWLRDSSLVAGRARHRDRVSGPDAGQIRSALGLAARNMTTLDVRVGQLRTAVAPYPVVKDLRVSTQFPHGMRIHVIEQLPGRRGRRRRADDRRQRRRHAAPRRARRLAADDSAALAPGRVARHRQTALDALALLAATPQRLEARISQVTTTAAARTGRAAALGPGHLLRHADAARREVGGGDRRARRSELGGRRVHRRDRSGAAGRRRRRRRRSPPPGSPPTGSQGSASGSQGDVRRPGVNGEPGSLTAAETDLNPQVEL